MSEQSETEKKPEQEAFESWEQKAFETWVVKRRGWRRGFSGGAATGWIDPETGEGGRPEVEIGHFEDECMILWFETFTALLATGIHTANSAAMQAKMAVEAFRCDFGW